MKMNMINYNTKEKFFNTIPHSFRQDFYDKKLNTSEWNLLLHLRAIADRYGACRVTADELRKDVFKNDVARGTVNDLLLSLRKGKYIWYPNRKGNGGPFQIINNHWLVSGGIWNEINDSVWNKNGGYELYRVTFDTEAAPEVDDKKRRSKYQSNEGLKTQIDKNDIQENGGLYNDIDNQKDNNYDRIFSKEVRVDEFVPNSEVDDKLHRIAQYVGEEFMGFVFWVYGKRGEKGIIAMEIEAANLYDYPNPRNKGALFNSRVRSRLNL